MDILDYEKKKLWKVFEFVKIVSINRIVRRETTSGAKGFAMSEKNKSSFHFKEENENSRCFDVFLLIILVFNQFANKI